MKQLLLAVFVAFLLISACSSNNKKTDGFSAYRDKSFTIAYPSSWTSQSSDKGVTFLAPKEEGFAANLMISTSQVKESVTAEAVADSAKQFQSKDYPEYKVISEGTITINGKSAFKRVYSWHSADYNLDVIQSQVLLKIGTNTLYTFTSTSLANKFDKEEPIFTQMVGSFVPQSSQQVSNTPKPGLEQTLKPLSPPVNPLTTEQIQCEDVFLKYFPESLVESSRGAQIERIGGRKTSLHKSCAYIFDNVKNDFILFLIYEKEDISSAKTLYDMLTNPIQGDINGVKVSADETILQMGDEAVLGAFKNFHTSSDGNTYDNYAIFVRKGRFIFSASGISYTINPEKLKEILSYGINQI